MISRYLLEGLIEGLGAHHRTSVFPCVIFQLKKSINLYKGEPNYDLFRLALKATALRLYPNYCNGDWTVQQSAVKADRELKKRILKELSRKDFDALEKRLAKDERLCYLLGLEFAKDKLQVRVDESPLEANGTMGKCKCSSFKIWLTSLEGVLNRVLTVRSLRMRSVLSYV